MRRAVIEDLNRLAIRAEDDSSLGIEYRLVCDHDAVLRCEIVGHRFAAGAFGRLTPILTSVMNARFTGRARPQRRRYSFSAWSMTNSEKPGTVNER